ncbi:MAG: hypothetical protein ABIO72_04305 [Patescibacteria group bacterium]
MASSSLFSKIVMLLLAVACLVSVYWFGMQVLEPVLVPPAPPAKSKVTFNPTSDVSQSPVFQQLEPLGPIHVDAGALGRPNPFVPLPAPVVVTSTATSTP